MFLARETVIPSRSASRQEAIKSERERVTVALTLHQNIDFLPSVVDVLLSFSTVSPLFAKVNHTEQHCESKRVDT